MQYFPLNEQVDASKNKFFKIIIKENFGGLKTYLNQIFLFEEEIISNDKKEDNLITLTNNDESFIKNTSNKNLITVNNTEKTQSPNNKNVKKQSNYNYQYTETENIAEDDLESSPIKKYYNYINKKYLFQGGKHQGQGKKQIF
jgi:hypothetical protein